MQNAKDTHWNISNYRRFIGDDTFREELAEWVTKGPIPKAWVGANKQIQLRELTSEELEADARFQLAIVLLENGKKEDAIVELKRAFSLDPVNWLIRKSNCGPLKHPRRFTPVMWTMVGKSNRWQKKVLS